jgi:hypothetical protein
MEDLGLGSLLAELGSAFPVGQIPQELKAGSNRLPCKMEEIPFAVKVF